MPKTKAELQNGLVSHHQNDKKKIFLNDFLAADFSFSYIYEV